MIEQRVLAAPSDGSLGPLLRLADDRLGPRAGYGTHAHRAVDVAAVVLAGQLRHRWRSGAVLRAGDVGVLRAGAGLEHDEVAGDDGARVLQAYLRADRADGPATHEVLAAAAGWIDLGRPDARLWVARLAPGTRAAVPAGLRIVAGSGPATVAEAEAGEVRAGEPCTVVVWALDRARPAWAGG